MAERLAQLYAEGTGWPCLGNPLWISEDPKDRAEVAPFCLSCPVLIDCRLEADARDEQFGVWAGVDRTPVREHRRPPTGCPPAESYSPAKYLDDLDRLVKQRQSIIERTNQLGQWLGRGIQARLSPARSGAQPDHDPHRPATSPA